MPIVRAIFVIVVSRWISSCFSTQLFSNTKTIWKLRTIFCRQFLFDKSPKSLFHEVILLHPLIEPQTPKSPLSDNKKKLLRNPVLNLGKSFKLKSNQTTEKIITPLLKPFKQILKFVWMFKIHVVSSIHTWGTKC